MANRINFTKRALEKLPSPEKGARDTYYDEKTPGLALRVTSAGTKTFMVYRRVQGRPERITLGRFPSMTVEQARTKTTETNATIVKGKSPNAEKKAIRDEITLKNLFDLYLSRHGKLHKKSWENDQAQFDRYLESWKARKLSNIRKSDIQRLHAKIGDKAGVYAANRLLSLLHTMFNKAIDWGWEGANPAHGVKKFKEKSRERFLEADELPRFFQALAEEPNDTVRDFFLISLLTGARRDNVLSMRWEQVSLNRTTWTIPDTKSGDPHTIPLIPAAVEILEARKADSDDEWVFPGTGKTGHLVEPKKAWKRILDRAGIENLRIHDLRRSLGSWQAATGANLSIIGKTLAHKNVSTTAIYARLNLDPVRDSMKKATDAMLEAGGLISKADVVKLKK
ncbi:MAG: tyrosine-type recombinase/integrase [Candidatus Sedimenticola sp. (ex Thyasira tokunagai)]